MLFIIQIVASMNLISLVMYGVIRIHLYFAIGQISWGIAWYINGYLIPEITVKRGETYTFKVEGGDNPSNQAKYHPFYITDDPKGGYVTKSDSEKAVGYCSLISIFYPDFSYLIIQFHICHFLYTIISSKTVIFFTYIIIFTRL